MKAGEKYTELAVGDPISKTKDTVIITTNTNTEADAVDDKDKKDRRFRKSIAKWMDSGEVQVFLGAVLMISLFLPDAWVLGNPPNSADDALYSILVVVFAIFILEIAILSYAQEGYLDRKNFFLWMDVLGTVSIILDIGWIANAFMPSGTSTKGSLLRAARAAKLGARYGRIMRLLKLMKFFKFLPCFNTSDEDEKEPTMSAVRKVSNELSSVLSKRVAFLVLFIVIIVPFLSHDTFDYSVPAWLDTFVYFASTNLSASQATHLDELLVDYESFYSKKDTKLVSFYMTSPHMSGVREKIWENEDDIRWQSLVRNEQSFVYGGLVYEVVLKTDETIVTKWGGMFGILLIILVILVLFGFSASFHNAVDVLVVVPLEKTMSALRESATLMLRSMKAFDQLKDEETKEDDDSDIDDEELETAMLERMVEKLTRLCKHLIPQDDLDLDNDTFDEKTANWLRDMQKGGGTDTTSKNTSSIRKSSALSILTTFSSTNRLAVDDSYSDSVVNPRIIRSFEFDTTQYSTTDLALITTYIFDCLQIFDDLPVPKHNFEPFIMEVGKYYEANPYHNMEHCIDVTHTLYRLLSLSSLYEQFSTLECFAALLAALGHDMCHPGVNNGYLVKSKDEIALRFNDVSPLENMHCAKLFEIMTKPKFNMLIGFPESDWREIRKIVIKAILGTDMVHHFACVKSINLFYEVHHDNIYKWYTGDADTIDIFSEPDEKYQVIKWLLHTADVSNPYKPFHICEKWAHLVVEEFHSQGDKEREKGYEVSEMNDRNSTSSLCNLQMGFIQFMIEPLVTAMVQTFPGLLEIGSNLRSNFDTWAQKRIEEISNDDTISDKSTEIEKLKERNNKFGGNMSATIDKISSLKRKYPII